jgi:Mg/Co/Ni transporter MgtE
VLGEDEQLPDDVPVTGLFLAGPDATVDDLIGPPWPVTVTPDAGLDEIAERLAGARHSWVVVVDEQERPLGRILADDVLDVLAPGRPRFRFPRRLS